MRPAFAIVAAALCCGGTRSQPSPLPRLAEEDTGYDVFPVLPGEIESEPAPERESESLIARPPPPPPPSRPPIAFPLTAFGEYRSTLRTRGGYDDSGRRTCSRDVVTFLQDRRRGYIYGTVGLPRPLNSVDLRLTERPEMEEAFADLTVTAEPVLSAWPAGQFDQTFRYMQGSTGAIVTFTPGDAPLSSSANIVPVVSCKYGLARPLPDGSYRLDFVTLHWELSPNGPNVGRTAFMCDRMDDPEFLYGQLNLRGVPGLVDEPFCERPSGGLGWRWSTTESFVHVNMPLTTTATYTDTEAGGDQLGEVPLQF